MWLAKPGDGTLALGETPAGLIQPITDAQNNVTTYGYDAHGNRTSVIDAMQNQTTFAYDSGDRLTTITYPDKTTTAFGYDYRGRRTSVTDQNQKQTTHAYRDADRLTSVTDAAQHMTQYAYDDENNLTSITDANSHMTGFQYDQFGRVKETDFPSGHAESYNLGRHRKRAPTTVRAEIPCQFPAAHAHEAGKVAVSPILRKSYKEIPWIPCAFPCLWGEICRFWAEFAEFESQSRKIGC